MEDWDANLSPWGLVPSCRHCSLRYACTLCAPTSPPLRLKFGSKFSGHVRIRIGKRIAVTVVRSDPEHLSIPLGPPGLHKQFQTLLWGVGKGSSVSWVAKFKGDENSECKLSNGWLRSYKVIRLLLLQGNEWSRSHSEEFQKPQPLPVSENWGNTLKTLTSLN